jgi:D-alanyl-D-alanine carboxypeptidase
MKKVLRILVWLLIIGLSIVIWTYPASSPAPRKVIPAATTKSAIVPAFNKTQLSTTDPSSLWVIVNKQHPLSPINYTPANLVAVAPGQTMQSTAAAALAQMTAGAKAAGYTISAASAYRSYADQTAVYNAELKTNGQAVADSESAHAGFSENQTGLAVDLASGSCSVADCFGTLPAGQWVAANAYKYGFILRYPNGLTDITGYRYEPWHFRYVGTDLSLEMHNTNVLTLEQFFSVSGGSNYK